MMRGIALALGSVLLGASCVGAASCSLPAVRVDASVADVQSAAAGVIDAFALLAEEALELELDPPSIEVWNTPGLAFFAAPLNRIVVPHWPTLDPASQSFFVGLTQSPSQAAAFFVSMFNEFLVAHEMAHWLQWSLGVERDLYALEREANDLAAAFFMACGDEDRLTGLAAKIGATTPLPNATPLDVDEESFFNAHYAELVSDPAKYGYYQFRFILESIDRRLELDWVTLLDALGK